MDRAISSDFPPRLSSQMTANSSGCSTKPRPACSRRADAMPRFIVRHFTAILVSLVLAWWSIFYLPSSPTWTVLWLRNAVQNRDGDTAARYIDFQSVVQNAAKDVVEQDASKNPLGAFMGQAAVQLFSQPLAQV